jgi:hypothetical protein
LDYFVSGNITNLKSAFDTLVRREMVLIYYWVNMLF